MKYREIPTMPGYAVSKGGVVIEGRTWRELKVQHDPNGRKSPMVRYRRVCPDGGYGKWSSRTVQSIVCEAWHELGCSCSKRRQGFGRDGRKVKGVAPTLENLRAAHGRWRVKGTAR